MYAALGDEASRHVTMQAQKLDPTDDDRTRVLLPLVFCRECGQEYFAVSRTRPDDEAPAIVIPRALGEQKPDQGDAGFIYLSNDHAWPIDEADYLDRLPDDWVEDVTAGRRVRGDRRDWVPQTIGVHLDGRLGARGEPGTHTGQWIPVPFRFCLACGSPIASQPARTSRS